MKATKRSVARAGVLACSVLAVALMGCRTRVVHEHTRTVYVPAPAPQPPPQVVYVPAPPQPTPPPVVAVPPPEQPAVVVIQSENDFYEPLNPYGEWVVVGAYGRCWRPARVEAGWRPYSNGYWQRSDAGWYWASSEPWGWATYHYGRWDFDTRFGWIWVPQTQWAPAWVDWREGGGYVGWAPLRPSARIGVRVEHVREPAFDSRAFVFVEHRRMLEPVRPKTVIVNNTMIINQTVNITKVTVVNKTVINEGPRPEVIERESGRQVRAVPVHELRHKEEETVAARQRNIPTARDRKVEPPLRTEPQLTGKPSVFPPVANQVNKPIEAVTPPMKPLATPARDEKKGEADGVRKIETNPPTARAEKAVLPRQEVRPVEKPTVVAKPAPQPAKTNPNRGEQQHETAIARKHPATSQTPGPDSKHESNFPAKVETVPPSAKPTNKHQVSPRQKSPAAEQAEVNKKRKAASEAKKQGDNQTVATNVVPTLPPQ